MNNRDSNRTDPLPAHYKLSIFIKLETGISFNEKTCRAIVISLTSVFFLINLILVIDNDNLEGRGLHEQAGSIDLQIPSWDSLTSSRTDPFTDNLRI